MGGAAAIPHGIECGVDGGRIGILQIGIQIGSLVSEGEFDRLEEGCRFRIFLEIVFREAYGTTCEKSATDCCHCKQKCGFCTKRFHRDKI